MQPKYKDPPETDNNVSESAASRNPDASSSEVADSLQHLDDADSVEFEINDDGPVVKHTTRGKVGWTPNSIRTAFLLRGRITVWTT